MWVSQRIADGSGNILDHDLGVEVNKVIIDLMTFDFDVSLKADGKTLLQQTPQRPRV